MEPDESPGPGQNPLDPLLEQSTQLGQQVLVFAEGLLRPWNAYQLLIVAAVLVLAWALKAVLGPRIRAWMARREGWPTWRMRILVVVHRRLLMIFFVLLIWLTVWIMREVTWPSRSYVLTIIAELATRMVVRHFRHAADPFRFLSGRSCATRHGST